MRRIVVAGIDTDVGKTIVAAILIKALNAYYWKPVQSGDLENSDTLRIKKLTDAYCYPEAYRFKDSLSPHHAAALENQVIDPKNFVLPNPSANLVIECSGGLCVPYTAHHLQIDIFSRWECEWILVSKNYLGSINHTQLSLEALKSRKINVTGIIFNGIPYPEGESAILQQSQQPLIGRIFPEASFTPKIIQKYAEQWKLNLN